MVGTQKESGLSEVIGFILIIAILVIIGSLYVTYVVPAHGREAEIDHMTYIKNQFIDFKMALDSLWVNGQINTTLSQNIEMGTIGQKTQGDFVFLPLAQPVGSAGRMEINTSADSGTIDVKIIGLIKSHTDGAGSSSSISGSSQITVNPDIYRQMLIYQTQYPVSIVNMVRIPITDTNIPTIPNDFTNNQSLSYHLMDIYPKSSISPDKANWSVSINLTRVPSFYITNSTGNASKFSTPNDNWAGYMRANYRYDLVMSLVKRNATMNYQVFQNFTLNSSDTKISEFWINLQDPAYGLDAQGPVIIKDSLANVYTGTLNITPNYDIDLNTAINQTTINNAIRSSYPESTQSTGSVPMGNFSYTATNYYWIPQQYCYQLGGVSLVQNDTAVSKVLPLITLGVDKNSSTSHPFISITRLRITGVEGNVAGSTPVQITSRVTGIRKGILSSGSTKYDIAPLSENAKTVEIIINSPDIGVINRWKNIFNSTKTDANMTSGFNTSWANITPGENTVKLTVTDPSSSDYNVTVDYSEVDAVINLQPVGWQGS
ncbi:MAG: hypothetical protein LUQ50_08175 [Methanospirillum sp.]|uniref:hypothetical protein n=1 Tax=Methanospirillum sp. TaxID=45200 RepID=UPI0023746DF7|nr:hypothetical protein [Methanospirillum sp.]MDD1729034.1 hypothetical protein [Methanospirillum sp.]